MTISLNYWSAASGFARIYVNGLASASKVWLERSRGQVKIVSSELSPEQVENALLSALGLSALDWAVLERRAQQPRPKGKLPGGAVRSETVPFMASAGNWTADDAAALDADAMANPIPDAISLLVDHREPAELKIRLRAITNLIVDEASLEVGDFVIPGKLTIERKSISDLVNSLTEDSKRLFFQTSAMTRVPGAAVLLLEGDVYAQQRLTLPSIAGTLSYLAVIQGVSIIPTMSLPHSAYMIAKLVRHAAFGLGYDLGLRGSAPKHAEKGAGFLLEGLPGISANLAQKLLKHFGSVRAVAAATEQQLKEVDGLGPKRARSIMEVLDASFG